jgi:hypothetical protein
MNKKFYQSINIFSNKNHTESYEQNSFNMCINFSSFQKFCLAIQYTVLKAVFDWEQVPNI